MGRMRYGIAFLLSFTVLMVAFNMRGGIGISVETDGSLFARGMLDEVNATLINRDNKQQKILAELVVVRGSSMMSADFLGNDAKAAATLNSGNQRLLTLVLDTANLDAGYVYKIGILVYENGNSTSFPVRGSLLAVAHIANIEICDPLDIVSSNMSLCNEIAIMDLESDETTS